MIRSYEDVYALPAGTLIRDHDGEIARRTADTEGDRGYVWQVLGDDIDRDGFRQYSASAWFTLPVEVLWPWSCPVCEADDELEESRC
jgi:hypothetical protein